MDVTANVSSVSLNVSTSTPFKVPSSRGRRRTPATKAKTFVRPVCDVCDLCGKEYRCHRSYVNHRRQHSIKDSASRFPNEAQIIQHCEDTACDDFAELSQQPAFGFTGEQYKELAIKLIPKRKENCSELSEFLQEILREITRDIGEYQILMPSAMINLLVNNCNALLSNLELRGKLCELVKRSVDCDSKICHCFVADYVLKLVTKIFKFYSSCLRRNVNVEVNVERDLTIEEKETIHYIGGAIVRSFFKKSQLYQKNVMWQKIGELITSRLLESDAVPGPPGIVKGWTAARSRGKLFFVSANLYEFFVGVAQILQRTSTNQLRIDASQVIKSVCESVVVILWDEAVGDSISESSSYDLMCGIIKSFCNTYGVGKKYELLNSIRANKAEASLALRASVAPRTSK